MKIKLDENLPQALCEVLSHFGHDVDTVQLEGLGGCDDDTVWAASQEARRFLITQDMDFSDLRTFIFGKHCGLMLLRLHEPSRRLLIQRVASVFETEDANAWSGSFVVVTDHKVRVRRAG